MNLLRKLSKLRSLVSSKNDNELWQSIHDKEENYCEINFIEFIDDIPLENQIIIIIDGLLENGYKSPYKKIYS